MRQERVAERQVVQFCYIHTRCSKPNTLRELMPAGTQVAKLHGIAAAEAVMDREVPLVGVGRSEIRTEGGGYCSRGKIRRVIGGKGDGGGRRKNVRAHDVGGHRVGLIIGDAHAGAVRRAQTDRIRSQGPSER